MRGCAQCRRFLDGARARAGQAIAQGINRQEIVALAASTGFAAPDEIRAERISVDGTLLRFSDAVAGDLMRAPASAPAFATINGTGLATSPNNGSTGMTTPRPRSTPASWAWRSPVIGWPSSAM